MNEISWIVILQFITMIIIIALWQSFIKPYLEQKGKNFASKEDVNKINSELNRINLAYEKELDLIKSTNSIIVSSKIKNIEDIRGTIVRILKAMATYQNVVMYSSDVDFTKIDESHYEFRNKMEIINELLSLKDQLSLFNENDIEFEKFNIYVKWCAENIIGQLNEFRKSQYKAALNKDLDSYINVYNAKAKYVIDIMNEWKVHSENLRIELKTYYFKIITS